MPTLDQEVVAKRIFENSQGRFQLVSQYKGRGYPVILHCLIHDINFEVSGDAAARTPIRCNCPECTKEKKELQYKNNRTEVECAYCGKKFIRPNSKLINSKSGLYFCCREHKDLAQRIVSGEEFTTMRPAHYGTIGITNYRVRAFETYPHKCAVCGWDEDEDILQVHHINENRQDNAIENLIILCPTCHWKITTHKYKLINRNQIVSNNT